MDIGVMTFVTSAGAPPDQFAVAAEERGFDLLLLAEHTHVPLESSERPRGGPIPDDYRRVLDPFVSLAFAAAATSRIRIGTGIYLVAQRDPISVAKATATLDLLSSGRLVFGVGFGWNAGELRNHGVDPTKRRAITREHVEAIRALWEDDVASYDGEHVSIKPSLMEPKPVQRPGPPVLLGADAGPLAFEHVAAWADGWYPSRHFERIDQSITLLDDALEAAGRARGSATVMACLGDPNAPAAGESVNHALVERLRASGVDGVVLPVPPGPIDGQRRVLDRYGEAFRHR